jgi:hypothetical protein
VGDDSHSVFHQQLLGKDGSVRRSVLMVKHGGLFSPKFMATCSHVFTQSPQNVAVEPGIHSLACWEKFFVLPQLLYRWRHQSGIFWILGMLTQTLSHLPQQRLLCNALTGVLTKQRTPVIQLSVSNLESGY